MTTAYRTATAADITPEMRESAREIADAYHALVAAGAGTSVRAAHAFQSANRRSRERHGDDLHQVVKALALNTADREGGAR